MTVSLPEFSCPDCGSPVDPDQTACSNCTGLLRRSGKEVMVYGYRYGEPFSLRADCSEPVFSFYSVDQCNRRLQVALMTRRCPFECSYCGIRLNGLSERPATTTLLDQLGSALVKFEGQAVDVLAIGCEGSMFDHRAIQPDALWQLISVAKARLPSSQVQLETRADLIREDVIRRLQCALNGRLGIKTSLETLDDRVRNHVLEKRLSLPSFERGMISCFRYLVPVAVFVMVKPHYAMTEQDGLREAMETCDYLIDFAERHSGSISIRLSATYPVRGTPWGNEAYARKYLPPEITTMAAVGLHCAERGVPVSISLWEEQLCDIDDTFWSHETSTILGFNRILRFTQTQNTSLLHDVLNGSCGTDPRRGSEKLVLLKPPTLSQ